MAAAGLVCQLGITVVADSAQLSTIVTEVADRRLVGAVLSRSPFLGIWAIDRLRRAPQAALIAGGRG